MYYNKTILCIIILYAMLYIILLYYTTHSMGLVTNYFITGITKFIISTIMWPFILADF